MNQSMNDFIKKIFASTGNGPSPIREAGKVGGIFLLVFLLFYYSRHSRIHNNHAFQLDEKVVLYLEEQTGLDGLIEHMDELEIHFDEDELRWIAPMLGWRNFNIGRYELSGSYTYQELLSKVALGLQDHASVTVLPGVNIGRLSAMLGSQLRADSSRFAGVFADTSRLIRELGYAPQSLFSRMLPDTYNIYWTSSPEHVIRRLYNEFDRNVVSRFVSELSSHPLELEELITLASIIEWEARFNDEKRRISGLYWNRLNRGMRLQADPTVIYAIGEHRRLLYEDYSYDHPYNTYQIDGLPPGPITNPDLASLEAAMDPEEHDFLYMVASPEGGHVFSRTFEEHRLASAEWRDWIREQFRIRAERERLEGRERLQELESREESP